VTLKAAVSLDGMLAGLNGRSRWITGEAARRFAHRLRLRHEAVLVGAETVRRDDPRLTVRLPGAPRQPLPVVLAPDLRLPPEARLLRHARPRVYVRADLPREGGAWEERATVVPLPAPEGALDVAAVLADLHRAGIASVLVEGGARTFAAFLSAAAVDEVALFTAPFFLGARGGTPLLDRTALADPGAAPRLREVRRLSLDGDGLLLARL
jgi:diaminohydroxyphosphoribosylaminopyrimidine deaminase/5-amino-6-(5-phosphoribosylamino)uracil reductase